MSTSSIASATSAYSTEAQASEENPSAVDVGRRLVAFLEIRHLLQVTQPYPAVMYPVEIHNGNHFVARGSLAIPPAMLADLAVVNRRNPNRLATLLGVGMGRTIHGQGFSCCNPNLGTALASE